MDAPEGAILKPWGWQKQVYADSQRETWLGYGEKGRTSLHRHESHGQFVGVIEGELYLHSPEDCSTSAWGMPIGEDNRHSSYYVPEGQRHYLSFDEPCWFTETYYKNSHKPVVPVTEDTIRE